MRFMECTPGITEANLTSDPLGTEGEMTPGPDDYNPYEDGADVPEVGDSGPEMPGFDGPNAGTGGVDLPSLDPFDSR
jgi:hypothetical protein